MRSVLIVVLAIVAAWLVFLLFVALAKPDDTTLRDALRLLPDIVRLVRRLVADREIPRRTRWLVWFLLGYLVLPIDLVPDFIPGLGYADDAVITSLVLRHGIRKSGMVKVAEHWPGTPEGLDTLRRLLRRALGRKAAPSSFSKPRPGTVSHCPTCRPVPSFLGVPDSPIFGAYMVLEPFWIHDDRQYVFFGRQPSWNRFLPRCGIGL